MCRPFWQHSVASVPAKEVRFSSMGSDRGQGQGRGHAACLTNSYPSRSWLILWHVARIQLQLAVRAALFLAIFICCIFYRASKCQQIAHDNCNSTGDWHGRRVEGGGRQHGSGAWSEQIVV